jgi:uncharacterized protein affecting Mg2+/Co2+ transport
MAKQTSNKKQNSAQKAKKWSTQTALNSGDEFKYSRLVSSSVRRFTIVKWDNQWFKVVKVKSSIRKLYDRHHELINRYGISVSMNDHRFVTFVDSNPVLSAQTALNSGDEFKYSRLVSSSVRRFTIVKCLKIRHECGKNWIAYVVC